MKKMLVLVISIIVLLLAFLIFIFSVVTFVYTLPPNIRIMFYIFEGLFLAFLSFYVILNQVCFVFMEDDTKMAQEANEAKSTFLLRVSHDIRTPISGIIGMLKLAQMSNDMTKIKNYLNGIQSSSTHLIDLVNDVLDLSKIEKNKIEVIYQPTDMNNFLKQCCDIIEPQAIENKILLQKRFTIKHSILQIDELHLRQILLNILGNSLKFTSPYHTIDWSVEETNSDAHKAEYTFIIQDTGIGMSEEYLEHIFEPFSQENNNGTVGSGLGMAIVKELVDLMGGSIEVSSKIGKGSRFVLKLHFTICEDMEYTPEDQLDLQCLRDMQILLVEDNLINVEIAKSFLEEVGCIVTVVHNGQEGIDQFNQSNLDQYDVILMDLMMPVLDGLSASKKIRALSRADAGSIIIIAMTANAYKEDEAKVFAAGMNGILIKPIDIHKLYELLIKCRKNKQIHFNELN